MRGANIDPTVWPISPGEPWAWTNGRIAGWLMAGIVPARSLRGHCAVTYDAGARGRRAPESRTRARGRALNALVRRAAKAGEAMSDGDGEGERHAGSGDSGRPGRSGPAGGGLRARGAA